MAEYKIIIEDGTTSSNKNPIAGSDGKGKSENAGVGMGSKSDSLAKGAMAYVALKRTAVSAVKSAISHQIGTISLRTGENERQQKVQFAYDMAEQAVEAGASIAAGAMAGGLPGAAIAAVGVVINFAVQLAIRFNEIDLKSQKESIEIGLKNKRAGHYVSVNGSR